jgi:hypothetical protein
MIPELRRHLSRAPAFVVQEIQGLLPLCQTHLEPHFGTITEERQSSDVATLLFADYTVSSILDKISRAKLDLKPAYQVRSGTIAHMFLYSVFS